jgi:hypothetical protein
MNFPLITLQPGGPRPPTHTQKANILAILGASPADHNHQDLENAIEALTLLVGSSSIDGGTPFSESDDFVDGGEP